MTKLKRILSISAGLSLTYLLFCSSTLLGILTDRAQDAKEYYMEAGTVGIDLTVRTGDTDDAILIEPDKATSLSIEVSNTGSKDCYVFLKMTIPEISGHPIISITPTGNMQQIEDPSSDEVNTTYVYQYVIDGVGTAVESGMTTPEMVAEARFYDFQELVDFRGEVKIVAYAVQTEGFEESDVNDTWSVAVTSVGE